MKTFDEIIPAIKEVLAEKRAELVALNGHRLIINRDLNGYVRILADESLDGDINIQSIVDAIKIKLEGRVPDVMPVLYDDSETIEQSIRQNPHFEIEGYPQVMVVDRTLFESDANKRTDTVATSVPRIVFYSIKGGVGRSTALSAAAWSFAEMGKRVLVLDMDLESPGITSSLLSTERMPMYGIADWLVEDLTDNGNAVIDNIMSLSDLSINGEIWVAPAHGKNVGEYVEKLGRAWMPKVASFEQRTPWYERLNLLIADLEERIHPDVLLIDSRAGIDEISIACLTCLQADTLLLFAMDSAQTWNGYQILFDYWRQHSMASDIREHLQVVGALIPETGRTEYLSNLWEHSWKLFAEKLYDEIPSGANDADAFNFDISDSSAPHAPWLINWNRGFNAQYNHSDIFKQEAIVSLIKSTFNDFVTSLKDVIQWK
ncbi:MAG: AAA family ATPase [Prevotellaceae bacterium]|jgi:cellulose biosynthesis protein BcsQ|nr:AAA family ATPase [Prevotellaceae bacterium]